MADSEKPKPPESPTTARELDFDDDEEVPTSSPKPKTTTSSASATTTTTEANQRAATGPRTDEAPPQPPRPMSPREQSEHTLAEAFPAIEISVIKAVLTASGGRVEPAFNALLGMSDPTAAQQDLPPPPPPRPKSQQAPRPSQTQIEQDELYARQLAQHYEDQAAHARNRQAQRAGGDPRLEQRSPNEMGYYEDDRERSFIDDDLPVIRENIRKGFLETQSKVNSFITNLRKKIDGDEEEGEEGSQPPQLPRRPNQAVQRSGEGGRRSGDEGRYDADPEVLGDDFTALQLRDETSTTKATARPLANPDLFKPTPATPTPASDLKVSSNSGRTEVLDDSLHGDSPAATAKNLPSGNKSKWQPLASVEPDPIAEHDPFSLGDSDDDETKKKDATPDETSRLQKATAEAMADELGDGQRPEAEPKVKS